jgi:hypothetical protein
VNISAAMSFISLFIIDVAPPPLKTVHSNGHGLGDGSYLTAPFIESS